MLLILDFEGLHARNTCTHLPAGCCIQTYRRKTAAVTRRNRLSGLHGARSWPPPLRGEAVTDQASPCVSAPAWTHQSFGLRGLAAKRGLPRTARGEAWGFIAAPHTPDDVRERWRHSFCSPMGEVPSQTLRHLATSRLVVERDCHIFLPPPSMVALQTPTAPSRCPPRLRPSVHHSRKELAEPATRSQVICTPNDIEFLDDQAGSDSCMLALAPPAPAVARCLAPQPLPASPVVPLEEGISEKDNILKVIDPGARCSPMRVQQAHMGAAVAAPGQAATNFETKSTADLVIVVQNSGWRMWVAGLRQLTERTRREGQQRPCGALTSAGSSTGSPAPCRSGHPSCSANDEGCKRGVRSSPARAAAWCTPRPAAVEHGCCTPAMLPASWPSKRQGRQSPAPAQFPQSCGGGTAEGGGKGGVRQRLEDQAG